MKHLSLSAVDIIVDAGLFILNSIENHAGLDQGANGLHDRFGISMHTGLTAVLVRGAGLLCMLRI